MSQARLIVCIILDESAILPRDFTAIGRIKRETGR